MLAAAGAWAGRTILHVVGSQSRAGTEVACRNLAAGLVRHSGARNVIAALDPGDGTIAEEFGKVASSSRLLHKGRWTIFRSSQALAREFKPAAAIIHLFGADQLAVLAGLRLGGVRRVVVVFGNPAPAKGVASLKWRVIDLLSRSIGARRVAATAHVARSLGIRHVAHHGCDVEAIAKAANDARAARTPGPFVFGTVARLDPIKDHRTLLNAFAMLRNGALDCELRIIGDGPLRATMEAYASALGIAGHVQFLGARIDIARQLGAMDVFVFPTTVNEGFGVVLIEALAAGVPVIASDVPACREVLADGRFGVLARPGDAAALADAMRATMSNKPPAAPRAEIEAAYGLRAMVQRYMQLLTDPRA